MPTLIFANGDMNDGPMVRRALDSAGPCLVIAADGGARVALRFERMPDVVIGDMDSLSSLEVEGFEQRGASIHRHPPEKNETDLELALKFAAADERATDPIYVVGGIGNRIDQTLANIYLLALPELMGRAVSMVAGRQQVRLLRPGRHAITGRPGDTVSLLPIGGDVLGVQTESLYYPLRDETLAFGPARGISNVMVTDHAAVSLETGLLLLMHTEGRA
jgi:thiamine pyrophosphokinase